MSDTDTNNRVAVLVYFENELLLGHAPNRKVEDNSWDFPKGHIEAGEDPKAAAVREVKEETNINIYPESLKELGTYKYSKGKITFYATKLAKKPEDIKCNSYFEMWGKQLPEFNKYKWVTNDEVETHIYKNLISIWNKLPLIEE